jgi:hypothetical protein
VEGLERDISAMLFNDYAAVREPALYEAVQQIGHWNGFGLTKV